MLFCIRHMQVRLQKGKLSDDAEFIFCSAYGLNNYSKINHAIAIPFWMLHYGCSFQAITSLLYGSSYDDRLAKWRACVPTYNSMNFNKDMTTFDHLPQVANFNAYSTLKSLPTIATHDTNDNKAIQQLMKKYGFSFSVTMDDANNNNNNATSETFQLAAIWHILNLHQRVWIALQVAKTMHILRNEHTFRFAGKFVFNRSLSNVYVGHEIISNVSNKKSPCAFIKHARAIRPHDTSICCGKQYLLRRLMYLQQMSFSQEILTPFVHLALHVCSLLQFQKFQNQLLATNLTPQNIFVQFDGNLPNISYIGGWDVVESVPPEIVQCWVPGWLWTPLGTQEPPDGFNPAASCNDVLNNVVRLAFVDKMEQLEPGYVMRTCTYQMLHLHLLGRLARTGLDFNQPSDIAFYDAAFMSIHNQLSESSNIKPLGGL